MPNLCVDCKFCKRDTQICQRLDRLTGFPINSKCNHERYNPYCCGCGSSGEFFQQINSLDDMVDNDKQS